MIEIGYQLTHDIDWFICINDWPIHVASNGGRLPKMFTSLTDLYTTKKIVYNRLDPIFDYGINEELQIPEDNEIDELGEEFEEFFPEAQYLFGEDIDMPNSRKTYLWSFVRMAQRGFYSFDKINMGDDGEEYQLVAYPKIPSDKYRRLRCYNNRRIVTRAISQIRVNDDKFKDIYRINKINLVEVINKSQQQRIMDQYF